VACPNEETLAALLDGRLVERAATEAHLDECESCRRLVADALRSRSGMDASPSRAHTSPALSHEHEPEDRSPGSALGRYLILELLGAGGMGVVYAAWDPTLQRRVAVKLLRRRASEARVAELQARLLREAQAMARLNHPHVIAVHDVGTFRGQVFVAMELVDGQTLTAWLREPRAVDEVLRVYRAAGEGLAAAHDAGLVHRDFKPDNVLVGKDGRVRVTDFGLARSVGAGDELTASGRAAPQDVALTRSGDLVGTPVYMSPEQWSDREADARSDQWSYCVALYEGLFGRRPFNGPSLRELRQTILAGHPERPRRDGVPAAVRDAVLRGLEVEPERRFPSMRALLGALDHDLHARRRRVRQIVAAVALVAVATTATSLTLRRRNLCRGADRQLAAAWDPARRRAMAGAFAATGIPFAAAAWDKTAEVIDGWTRRWVSMHEEACEATRVRGEQSEELLDLRMQCLAERLDELRSLGDEYLRPDAALVERSVTAASGLQRVEDCADARALSSRTRPPRDAATRAKIEALSRKLAGVSALVDAARYTEAVKQATPLADEARATGHRPTEAHALLLLAQAEQGSADAKAAEPTLHRAIEAAEAGRDDQAAARGWGALAYLVGERLNRFSDERLFLDHARAALERLGGDAAIEQDLANTAGALAYHEGRRDDELKEFERAVALRAKMSGPDDGRALTNLAMAIADVGRLDDSIAAFQKALTVREALFGPHHPEVALTLDGMAGTLEAAGRDAEAMDAFRRALRIREEALGLQHPDLAMSLNGIATLLQRQGKFDEAIRAHERVLAIVEKDAGKESLPAATVLANLSADYGAQGKGEPAVEYSARALAIKEKLLGPNEPELGQGHLYYAEALLTVGKSAEAEAQSRRALASFEQALGPDHRMTAYALTQLGKLLVARRDFTDAQPLLERAHTIRQRGPGDPRELAETQTALAQALWATGRRDRARDLLREARATLVAAGDPAHGQLVELDDWARANRAR
jgi:tetratricopeptide (TPR) repeat protein